MKLERMPWSGNGVPQAYEEPFRRVHVHSAKVFVGCLKACSQGRAAEVVLFGPPSGSYNKV